MKPVKKAIEIPANDRVGEQMPIAAHEDHIAAECIGALVLGENPITFDSNSDKKDPKNWRGSYKWLLIFLMSGITLTSWVYSIHSELLR